jgi:hypothetical protein
MDEVFYHFICSVGAVLRSLGLVRDLCANHRQSSAPCSIRATNARNGLVAEKIPER